MLAESAVRLSFLHVMALLPLPTRIWRRQVLEKEAVGWSGERVALHGTVSLGAKRSTYYAAASATVFQGTRVSHTSTAGGAKRGTFGGQ